MLGGSRGSQVCLHVGDHLGDADIWIALAEKAERVVETDAIDLEGIDPVEADVANELLNALVVVIEFLEEAASGERTDER